MNGSSLSKRLHALLDNRQHIKHMEKGCFLFQESTSANDLYYILSGKVELSKVVPDGRDLTLRICSENDLVGETILFSLNPKYMMNAKMLEDGNVAVISKESLEQKISSDSSLAIEMITWLSAQNRKNQAKFRDMLLHGKKGHFTLPSSVYQIAMGRKLKMAKSSIFPLQTKNSPIFAGHHVRWSIDCSLI